MAMSEYECIKLMLDEAQESVREQRRIVQELADMLHICLGCGQYKRICSCKAEKETRS